MIMLFSLEGGLGLIAIILCLLMQFPAFRMWAIVLGCILLGIVLYTVSIWVFCGVLAVLLGAAFCGIYRAHKEQQDWESKQPQRATGYNPNNGWEYVENDTDDH